MRTGGYLSKLACIALPDRKSTRLNSSHLVISYAVFCLKKKKMVINVPPTPALLLLPASVAALHPALAGAEQSRPAPGTLPLPPRVDLSRDGRPSLPSPC